ncbi:MAG: HD domain-containing phosphohydrolase [Sedimenticola sp.]
MVEQTGRPLILIVDDAPENIDVLVGILRAEYEIIAALSGEKALDIICSDTKPDIILLDVMMPGMDGYQVCRKLKANPATAKIPVIFVTAKEGASNERHGFELGAVDYITKPVTPSIVEARVRTHVALYNQQRELSRQVDARTQELGDTRLKIIQRLGRAAEYKDNETGLHVIRMSYYSKMIAQAYGGNSEWVDLVFNAAPMHDIGKIGISDAILQKPGKLSPDEWVIMKKHPVFGAEIIGADASPLLQMSQNIALTHHEKWDGSGYPYGHAEEDISLEGRIVAVADVFDALTTERPYKKAWTVEEAVEWIDASTGTHFDPALVQLFHKVMPDLLRIKERYAESSHG